MPTPVIIDTDPGVDDVLALLFALASPEIEILAIIITFGNTDVDASYENIFKIYHTLEQHFTQFPHDQIRFPNVDRIRKPILARGASLPLEGELHSAQYFHGRDGLGNVTQRHPELTPPPMQDLHPYLQLSAVEGSQVALELVRAHPARSITYIALGPMTTLAQVMRADAKVFRERVGRVISMGGALDVPGNTSPVAEFNFFADPFAVRELLTQPDSEAILPLDRFLMLPLDITTPHELSFPLYTEVVDAEFENTHRPSQARSKAPLTHFTSSFLERTREVMLEFGNDAMELHDIVAVWCAIANPPVADERPGGVPGLQQGWSAVRRKFEVERTGELTRGMLVVDRRVDETAYAPGANRAHVQAELERLTIEHGILESTAIPAAVEVDTRERAFEDHGRGVACVVQTPGKDALVKMMLERIWGVMPREDGRHSGNAGKGLKNSFKRLFTALGYISE